MAKEDIILNVSLDGAQEELNNLTLLQKEITQLANTKKKLNGEQKLLLDQQEEILEQRRKLSKNSKTYAKDLEDLNRNEKALADSLTDLSEQQVENNLIIKETKKEYQEAEKSLIRNTKAQKVNKGSIAQMRLEVAAAKKAYFDLSKEERDNAKVGGVMKKALFDQTEELKKLEKEVGVTSRSVGDYGQATKGMLPLFGAFGQQIESVIGNLGDIKESINNFKAAQKASALASKEADAVEKKLSVTQRTRDLLQRKLTASTTVQTAANKKMTLSQKAAAIASSGLTKAMKFLKVALISTGIGALVVALGSVVVFLTKTQKGAEIVSKAMAGIGAVVDVLVDRLAGVGEAISQLFSGDISGAAETFGKATSGVADEIANETKQAIKLKAALIEVEKAENDLILQRAATRAEVKELNKLAEDTTKGYEERGDAARKAIAIEEDLLNKQVENQKKRAANLLGDFDLTEERLAMLKKEGVKLEDVGINISDEEDRAEAIQEIAKIFELQQESLELQTTLTNKLNTIEGQKAAERKKEQDAINKKIKETAKLTAKAEAELAKAREKATQNEVARAEEAEKAILDNKAETLKLEAQLELATAEHTEEEKFKLALDLERKLGALRLEQNKLQSDNLIKKEEELQKKLFDLKKAAGGKETAETIKTQDELNAVTQEKERVQGPELTQIKLENKLAEAEKVNEEDDRLKEEADEKQAAEDEEELERLKIKEEGKEQIKNAAVAAGERFVEEAFNNQNRRIDEGLAREVDALNLKREAGEISEEEFNAKRLALDKKAFKDRKRLALVQNVIDTAVGIGKTFANLGFVAGAAPAIALGIEGAANAVIIGSQKFAKGGVIHGASHAQGGVNVRVGGSGMIEAEGGEAIINKRSTAKHLPLLSAINQSEGGVPLAAKGMVTPNMSTLARFGNGGVATPAAASQGNSLSIDELRQAFSDSVNTIKVQNVASETTGVSNRVQQIQDSASF